MSKLRGIEISFPVGVELPDGWERALDSLVNMVCEKYERENPARVMWPANFGSKPLWSKTDAAFLGVEAAPDAPPCGDPGFDDSVFVIGVCEREDFHGRNPHNPDRERLRKEAKAAREQRKS